MRSLIAPLFVAFRLMSANGATLVTDARCLVPVSGGLDQDEHIRLLAAPDATEVIAFEIDPRASRGRSAISLDADLTNATNGKTIKVTGTRLLRSILDVGRRYTAVVRVRFRQRILCHVSGPRTRGGDLDGRAIAPLPPVVPSLLPCDSKGRYPPCMMLKFQSDTIAQTTTREKI